ncbi:MAG TPA: polyprenyl synthetase family protein [Saprospiraceae bacterium]|jgi:geranylgeranyl pyrophosphate synthase|nr:polyprenyl synthetase family protein [Saprospiraceae bacterium]
MERAKYFDYLQETSKLVLPIIKEQVEKVSHNESELKAILLFFYEKRFSKSLLKPALFRLAYEICGGKNFNNILPIAAAFEVLNISSYQANASFDNKIGVLTKEEKDSQFIASMISREISDNLINQCEGVLSDSVLNKVRKCVSKSNSFIYKAQHYDLNLLSVHKIDKYEDYKFYLKHYIDRCYFGSGVFSGQCALAGAVAANATENQQELLMQFGELYGTALHIINDLADYYPGEERKTKLYQDDFCDFRNGRLTLPLYLLLNSKNEEVIKSIAELSKKEDYSFEDYSLIQNFISKEGIVEKCKTLTNEKFIKAKQHLKEFPLDDTKQLLLALLSVLESNKFYHRIKHIQIEL